MSLTSYATFAASNISSESSSAIHGFVTKSETVDQTSTGEKGLVGVLVVHGIGRQERGETLANLLEGLARVAPDSVAAEGDDRARGVLNGQPVCFYEVYWADLFSGDKVRRTFNLTELQSLAWFPWLNKRRGSYRSDRYSGLTVLVWTLFLAMSSVLMWLAYFGARLFAQLYQAVVLQSFARENTPGKHAGFSWAEAKRHARERAHEYTAIDLVMDDFIADILNYVNSAGDAFLLEDAKHVVPEEVMRAYQPIIDRFYKQLLQARADGCTTIQVLAHSLGTVVAYHALRGFRFNQEPRADEDAIRDASARVTHLYTIGSPLEKIRFFWPRLMPTENLAGDRSIEWDNFVSRFDPVAGVLRRYREWGVVRNHHLLGGGFIRAHVVYEHSAKFLGVFTHGLCGKPLQFDRTLKQWMLDTLFLLGETLFAPLSLGLILLAGTGVLVLLSAVWPMIIALPFRLLGMPELWIPIQDYGTLIAGGIFFLVLLLAPLSRAHQVHERYWKNR